MVKANIFPHDDYVDLYRVAQINPGHESDLAYIKQRAFDNKAIYDKVAAQVGLPWWLIAALNELESGQDFSTYPQNGDPLFDSNGNPIKTTDVPAGVGPYDSWADAAIDAYGSNDIVTIGPALYYAEEYNGWGYRARNIPSPYLWSYTDQYQKGKYVSDGVFDPDAVSDQAGVAAILKTFGI
jgi:lysozyme family protein